MKLLTDDDFGLNDRVRVGRERLCGKCSLIIVDIHVLRATRLQGRYLAVLQLATTTTSFYFFLAQESRAAERNSQSHAPRRRAASALPLHRAEAFALHIRAARRDRGGAH